MGSSTELSSFCSVKSKSLEWPMRRKMKCSSMSIAYLTVCRNASLSLLMLSTSAGAGVGSAEWSLLVFATFRHAKHVCIGVFCFVMHHPSLFWDACWQPASLQEGKPCVLETSASSIEGFSSLPRTVEAQGCLIQFARRGIVAA